MPQTDHCCHAGGNDTAAITESSLFRNEMKAHDCVPEGKTSVADAGVEITGGGSIYNMFHIQICACWLGLVT